MSRSNKCHQHHIVNRFRLTNFPDDFSSMEILQCRVNDGDEANIGAIADVVVDEELEVGDVEEGQTLRRFYSSFI